MNRIPDNVRRLNHFCILFDPTKEEIQLSSLKKENKNLKKELSNIKEKVDFLIENMR